MRLALSQTEEAIREETRHFLVEHPRPAATADLAATVRAGQRWQGELAAARLVAVTWPRAYGGRDAAPGDQVVVTRELARGGMARLIGFMGLDVVGPSILKYGTDAQKTRLIPPILSSKEIWCQGFSEPDAGSDLASLRTRAEVRSDGFVVTGRKIWTTFAQFSRWCALLARTDSGAHKHEGISYLLVDMSSPGITVRPITLISGESEFNEVLFEEVFVPRSGLLGPLNGGWGVAMHTLASERATYGAGRQAVLRVMLDSLLERARRGERDGLPLTAHADVARALAGAHVAVEVLGHHTLRSLGRDTARGHPGVEASVDKLFVNHAEQEVGRAVLAVLGPHSADGPEDKALDTWRSAYLYSRAASVYGGTSQIQRNIVAQRVLGLPRSS